MVFMEEKHAHKQFVQNANRQAKRQNNSTISPYPLKILRLYMNASKNIYKERSYQILDVMDVIKKQMFKKDNSCINYLMH